MPNWKRIAATLLLSAVSILAAGTAGCAHNPVTPVVPPPPPIKVDWTITFKWNYDYTNNFTCSTTVTKGCVSGFTVGYMQGTTRVPLNTMDNSVCTGTTQPLACQKIVNAQLPIGTFPFYGVANFLDVNGVAGTSSGASTIPTAVAAGDMTNFTESHQ